AAAWPALDAPLVTQQELVQPQRPIHNGVDAVDIAIGTSTNRELAVEFRFPEPQFWEIEEEGKGFLRMAIPGMEQGYGPVGLPAIPFYSRLVAVPHGAQVSVANVRVEPRFAVNGRLYPVQYEPVDASEQDDPPVGVFEDLPFEMDTEFYGGDSLFPQQLVAVEPVGQLRGLNLVRVSVATGRYNPATQMIQVVESVGLRLTFEGGEGFFLTRRDILPVNAIQPAILGLVLNHRVIEQHINPGLFTPICFGVELLIITDPAYRTEADRLADWKRTAGISTFVQETGSDPADAGTTASQIKQTVQDRYDDCLVQLSYLLLLGDAEHIPPWYNRTVPRSTGVDTPGSDLEYSLLSGADILPDLAVGRIPVDTLIQAQDVVDKIVNYESTPPNNADFYDTMTVASYFQCCEPTVDVPIPPFGTIPIALDGVTSRSFIETSELVKDELDSEGYTVNRIYTTSTAYHSNSSNSNYYDPSRSTVPYFYNNTAPLPTDLGINSGFAWDGSTSDIQDAFNDGTFLMLHRDHGAITGWGSPSFRTWDHTALTNGNLTPVVYSINCASGLFDNETRNPANDAATYNTTTGGVYWAEDLLRRPGGAVGIIGDNRNSPTWANSALARGLIDATWPGTVSEGTATSINRLGDIMNYGKLYMLGQVGVAQTAGSVSQQSADDDVLMYHVFGDPTLAMWTASPHRFSLVPGVIIDRIGPHTWRFRYAVDGSSITAMQNGLTLARGVVENGVATLRFVGQRQAGDTVDFIVNHPETVPVMLDVKQRGATVSRTGGGSVLSPNGRQRADFLANAVDTDVDVIFTTLNGSAAPLPTGRQGLQFFHLDAGNADGDAVTSFAEAFTLQACPDADQTFDANTVISYFDEETETWVDVPTTFDAESGCVTAELDHLTEFAVQQVASTTIYSQYLPAVQR
ncbi:MAG: C25 family cysteine peptidase, partial [Litorilinea sp.]